MKLVGNFSLIIKFGLSYVKKLRLRQYIDLKIATILMQLVFTIHLSYNLQYLSSTFQNDEIITVTF